MPRELAYDVLLFAQRNPQPCPVLDVDASRAASRRRSSTGDLRTDLPAYVVYEHGELVAEVTDVREHWRDDLVPFLIGCSFTFETALLEAGVPVRHVEAGHQRADVPHLDATCRPAGSLHGPLVVSMRPVPADLVATAVRVTSRYPAVHGAPGARRRPGRDRHHRPRRAGLRGPGRGACRRGPGLLGLRGHPAGGGDGVAARRSRSGTPPGTWPITDVRDSRYVVP